MLGEWLRRRRAQEAKHRAARERLYQEYQERLDAKDPDALESSRDYGDHDLSPWRFEVTGALVFLAFAGVMLIVVVLIAFFAMIKQATGG